MIVLGRWFAVCCGSDNHEKWQNDTWKVKWLDKGTYCVMKGLRSIDLYGAYCMFCAFIVIFFQCVSIESIVFVSQLNYVLMLVPIRQHFFSCSEETFISFILWPRHKVAAWSCDWKPHVQGISAYNDHSLGFLSVLVFY